MSSNTSILVLKKRKNFLKLHQQLYVGGIKQIKLRLLELHPEFAYIIRNVYMKLLVKYQLFKKSETTLIVESAPKNKLMTLKDKGIFLNPYTLITNWYQILGAVLTLKEKDCKPFWNVQCEEKSKRLWFPIETGYADLDSNSLNGFYQKPIQNSWFSTKQQVNPQARNSQKIFSPLYMYSPVKKWEKESIRGLKLKLRPTKSQKIVLEEWCNTTRYVYNKVLAKIKADPSLNNARGYLALKKECITAKDNNIVTDDADVTNLDKYIYNWELNTPKDIRNGALRDIKKAYKTAFSNLRNGNIGHFGLDFRRKKNYANQSIEVPASAIKLIHTKNNTLDGLNIYKNYLPSTIRFDKNSVKGLDIDVLSHDTRLKKENNEWYLCVAVDVKGRAFKKKERTCALDPGIRKFQTIYSEDAIISIIPDFKKNNRLLNRLDKLKSLRGTKQIRQRTYDKHRCMIQAKLTHIVDEMHYKTIRFLTKNYTSILLPSFETQEMVRRLHRKTARNMMNFSFYKFKQRLQDKCALLKNCNVTIVNEAYTSQTCGSCGELNPTKEEFITCKQCDRTYDRDVNGSRNIYMKYVN